MAPTQAKRKRGGQLDLDDMERRMIEFRVTLEREKRRCFEAKMMDKFEKLLRDKLNEDIDPNQGQLQENTIQLTSLDEQSFHRLASFLEYAITMCRQEEQQQEFQRIIREMLLQSRRQTLAYQRQFGKPVEPLCLGCGCQPPEMRNSSARAQQTATNTTNSGQENGNTDASSRPVVGTNGGPNSFEFPPIEFVQVPVNTELNNGKQVEPETTSVVENSDGRGVMFTPPPSAAPTPDVGEQPLLTSLDNAARQPSRSKRIQQQLQRADLQQAGSQQVVSTTSLNYQPARTTNASTEAAQNARHQQPLAALQQTTTTSALASLQEETVNNSDEDDDDDTMEPADEIRSILDDLRETRRLSQMRRSQSQQQQQSSQQVGETKKKKLIKPMLNDANQIEAEEDQRRSSTPLSESTFAPMVIDEQAQPASPISKSSSGPISNSALQKQAQEMRQASELRGSRIEQVSAKLMRSVASNHQAQSARPVIIEHHHSQPSNTTQSQGSFSQSGGLPTSHIKKRTTKKRSTRESSKQLRQSSSQY